MIAHWCVKTYVFAKVISVFVIPVYFVPKVLVLVQKSKTAFAHAGGGNTLCE